MTAPPTGTFNIVLAGNPRLAVTSPPQSNQPVISVQANNAATQKWTVTVLSGNIVKIVNQATNLAIFAPQQGPGATVIGGPPGPPPSAWLFKSTGVQNQYNITTFSSQSKLALTARSNTNPGPLILTPTSADPLQRWTLVRVPAGGSA